MDWLDAVERLGISGALLVMIVLTVRYYLGPWFSSFVEAHNNLIAKLGQAIHSQEEYNANQTALLKAISEEEKKERELIQEVRDGIQRIEDAVSSEK